MIRRTLVTHAVVAACALAVSPWSLAQSAGAGRPITIVVPLAPGGDTDTVARLIAEGMAAELKQSVVVDNRAGAGGQIGMQAVANAAPDGHTLGMAFQAALTVVPHLRLKPPYDPTRDFTPIGRVATTSNALVVRADSPIRTVQELVAKAKAAPDKLSYGSWGIGSGGHLAGEIVNAEAGIRTQHVPYKGTSEVVQALIGGEVDYAFVGYGLATAQSKGGKVRVVSVLAHERSPTWPQVATLKESGFSFAQEGWFGLVGPPGLPEETRKRLESALLKVAGSPAVADRLASLGITASPKNGAEFKELIRRDYDMWGAWLGKLDLPKS